jgi:hypothetical protein
MKIALIFASTGSKGFASAAKFFALKRFAPRFVKPRKN